MQERLEAAGHLVVLADEFADALDVALGDLRHVLGPLVPVDTRAALLDQRGLDGLLPALDREEREPHLHALRDLRRLLALLLLLELEVAGVPPLLVGRSGNLVLLGLLLEGERVDLGLDSLVVRAEGLEDAPDVREHLAVVERLLRRHAGGDENGQDDIAEVLALGAPHDAADGLDDVNGRVLGIEEDDGVEVGHVDALGEAARVGEDAALVLGDVPSEPGDVSRALVGRHVAVDMAQLALERELLVLVFGKLLDDLREGLRDGLRCIDGRAEADGAVQRLAVGHHGLDVIDDEHATEAGRVVGRALAVIDEALPAADNLAYVRGLQAHCVDALVALQGGQAVPDGILLDGEDDDLVVGEQLLLHGLAELDLVGGGAVDGLVVHGGDGVVLLGAFAFGGLAVDARGRRHVQALLGGNVLVEVDLHEGRSLSLGDAGEGVAGRAVGLVAHDDIKLGHAERLRVMDDADRLIGRENDDQPVGVRASATLERAVQALGIRRCGILE